MDKENPKIAISTTTRADFGLLSTLGNALQSHTKLNYSFWVSGAHLEPEFGLTLSEIESSGLKIGPRFSTWSKESNSLMLAKTIEQVDRHIRTVERPDAMIVLGDRFETLGVALASHLNLVPIIHLHGGEVSEGAFDEECRHAITKLSCRHYCASDLSRRRILQMGESPDAVLNVGALGIENTLKSSDSNHTEVLKKLGLPPEQRFILCTLHPDSRNPKSSSENFCILKEALDQFPDHGVIWTYPNTDQGYEPILLSLQELQQHEGKDGNRYLIRKSLGLSLYNQTLRHADVCVGNSSSGLIEASALQTPCVNIGDRQLGREHGSPMLNTPFQTDSIVKAISEAIRLKMDSNTLYRHPFGMGDTSKRIAEDLELCFERGDFFNRNGKSFQLLEVMK